MPYFVWNSGLMSRRIEPARLVVVEPAVNRESLDVEAQQGVEAASAEAYPFDDAVFQCPPREVAIF